MKTKIHIQKPGLPRGETKRWHHPWPLLALVAALPLVSAHAGWANHDISAGTFIITSEYGIDNNNNCTNTLGLSINGFRPGTYNRADLNVQVGDSGFDNVANGILISSVMENGRTNFDFGTNNFYSISGVHDASPIYRIVSFTSYRNASGAYAAGAGMEYNVNVAGAWFPYSRYLGGLARNSVRANGGSNDVLASASPQLVWGTHFRHIAVSNELATTGGWLANPGQSVLDLTSLGINSKTDGVLLVNHGKDEQNFALSHANEDGTWTMYVHDNGTGSAGSYEQDPIAFVYIPRTNIDVVSGKFNADGTIAIYSGAAPEFTVTPEGTGRWHLQMNNYASSNGVLIISAEGGTTYNLDNIVSYQIEGSGWQIQSRDTPANGLQTPNADEAVVSFVFIPAPPIGFNVTPSANLQTSESGGVTSFTVALNAKPTADVTLNYSASDASEGLADPPTLIFNTDNWYVPQTVYVYGMDDAETDGQVPYRIVFSPATSADSRFNGLKPADVGVLNADNEPGVTLSANTLTTTEAGGTATFTVVLNTPPTGNVTIGLSSSDTTEGRVSPASLTFTPSDYTIPQTVTVTGVDDSVLDGDVTYKIIVGPASSTDPLYNGFKPLDVSMVNRDNDLAGVTITPAGPLTVSETGTTADFSVALSSQPAADVTLSFASGDTTEGTVSPAARTFTPANWATPQTFTLTGVDDLSNDGAVSYTLTGTVTSTDPAFAALHPTVTAITLDNEPVLSLPSGTLVYGIGWPGMGIDGSATITDPDTTSYNGGSLTFTLTANGTSDDRLEIRSTGTDLGQISVAGSTVSFGGTPIGTFTGGTGTTPLVVSFNAAANPTAAQGLVRNVTFRSVSSNPNPAARTLTVTLADGQGGTSTASKQIILSKLHISDFQEGKDGGFGVYSGAKDIEILALTPDTGYPTGSPVNGSGLQLDWGASSVLGPDEEVLLRFDNIIGTNAGQIPPGATVVEADLLLNVVDSGDGSPLARMLIPWEGDAVTWNSMGDGVQLDGIEADASFIMQGSGLVADTNRVSSQIGLADLTGATGTGIIRVSVLPDVQYWANGGSNYGWVMPCWKPNADNTIFSPSEATNIASRPRLLVKWLPSGMASASFRQGVDGYAGTVDTRIRKSTPDTEYSAVTGIFVDFEVTSGMEDPEHALLRFDSLFGTDAGQIPPGAKIHAAILDLGDLVGDATGDGGTIHRMLQPWEATNSWNMFVDGVSANNVEAAATPTASAGSSTLDPNVSGGYVSFDVTPDVQLWANGTPNYGWAFLPWPYGGDGWGFATSEHPNVLARPQLRVYYEAASTGTSIVLLKPVVSPASVQVKFTGAVGKTYTVLRSPAADAAPGAWTVLGTMVVPEGGTATYSDNSPLPNAAFYRVRE